MKYNERKIKLEINNPTFANLKEDCERWRFIFENSGLGIWDWNVQTNEIYIQKGHGALHGFEEIEINKTLDEWAMKQHTK